MNQSLGELQKRIEAQSVIDRKMLAERLKCWIKLGLPPHDQGEFNVNFNIIEWQRPVFTIGEETKIELDTATVASIQRKDRRKKAVKVTFDPEFNLFGVNGEEYSLAGLRPWVQQERRSREADVWKHRPISDVDPIGELAGSLARQQKADFTAVRAKNLYELLPHLEGSRYLLFATHPLFEVEIHSLEQSLSYLTFYTFENDLTIPLDPQGNSAESVHTVISLLEKEAKELNTLLLDSNTIENARQASHQIAIWLQNSRILPKRGQQTYFLPIPVALVAILS